MGQIPNGWIWLVIAVLCGIIEGATAGLATIWFAIGAIVSMIVAFLGGGLFLQIVLFLLISLALLIFTRPIAVKYLRIGSEKTNADRLIGEVGIVTEPIDNVLGQGRVKVMGQSWSADSMSGEDIDEKTEVEVVSIHGVKLTVKIK